MESLNRGRLYNGIHLFLKVSEYELKSYMETEVKEYFYVVLAVIECLYSLLLFELHNF